MSIQVGGAAKAAASKVASSAGSKAGSAAASKATGVVAKKASRSVAAKQSASAVSKKAAAAAGQSANSAAAQGAAAKGAGAFGAGKATGGPAGALGKTVGTPGSGSMRSTIPGAGAPAQSGRDVARTAGNSLKRQATAGGGPQMSAKERAADAAGSTLKQAAVGAAQGAIVGGGLPGAAVGAAKGAAQGLLTSRGFRPVLIIILLMMFAAPLYVVASAAALTSSAVSALGAANKKLSQDSATQSGLTQSQISTAMDASAENGIPWEISLAVKGQTGTDVNVPALQKALTQLDPGGTGEDLGAGSVYSSGSSVRTIGTSTDSQAAQAAVQKTWTAALAQSMAMDPTVAASVYSQALGWYLGQSASSCSTTGSVAADTTGNSGSKTLTLSAAQVANAKAIIQAAIAMGLGVDGQTIGVMTALGESSLNNISYGDLAGPDSRGLFQQRNSWGSLADRMDPTKSATLFFQRLVNVKNWRAMAPTIAAHTVQVNADPQHYAKYFPQAQQIVASLGGGLSPSCAPRTPGDDYPWPNETMVEQGGSLSPLRYYYRECVDFVAWRLNRDAGVTQAPWKYTWSNLTPLGGDAKDWKANWQLHGWTTSTTPVVGSVAWWSNSNSGLGHVAYVQAVNANGTVSLEEYNWFSNGTYSTRTIANSKVDLFLYPPPR